MNMRMKSALKSLFSPACKIRQGMAALLTAAMIMGFSCSGASALEPSKANAGMRFVDGMAQPILTYSSPQTPNEDSDILRLCVYVETDHDTDGDGMADLVKVFLQLPRPAVEGQYRAAAVYDPTPYPAGVFEMTRAVDSYPYAEDSFDYDRLYAQGEKRTPVEEITTLAAAEEADPSAWLYTDPGNANSQGYYQMSLYDYYLIRGFAVVEACGIGTYGSEGFELCGFDLERDSHKCVVEWLAGERNAFSDRTGRRAIRADWCSGSVAMTGVSYGGTLPYEVAVTGVSGLKTIIPVAGISNWYDYTNSQGVSTYSSPNYTDCLASYNAGACFMDDDWTVVNDNYGAWIKQVASDEIRANGNYTGIWKSMDYSVDTDAINCSALIVHGLNDFNVLTKQSDLMYRAFRRAGQNVKLLLHQNGHAHMFGMKAGDILFDDLVNKWLCHYLCGVENGIEDMPEVTVQSNLDGSFTTHDSWTDAETDVLHAKPAKPQVGPNVVIHNGSYDRFYEDYLSKGIDPEQFFLDLDAEHALSLPLDVPEGTTIYGIPEVHVKLSTQDVDQDNRMVCAMLMDMASDGRPFRAFMVKKALGYRLPKKTVDSYEYGGDHERGSIKEFVQSPTRAKLFSRGWMDLMDPGAGYISSGMPEPTPLVAGAFYDYTIFLSPTVYTLEEGHKLVLMLVAQDPYKTRYDDIMDDTPEFNSDVIEPVYAFTVDCASVDIELPVLAR